MPGPANGRIGGAPRAASRRRSPIEWIGLGAVCVLLACGGEAAPASQSGEQEAEQVSACDLLTAAEIEEATGVAPGEATSRALGSGFLECRWMTPDGSDQLVYVALRPAGAPRSYQEWVDEYRAGMGDDFDETQLESYELISEVADQFALWSDGGALGGQFQMYTGGRALIVSPMMIEGKSNQGMAMALASHATMRLP